MTDDTSAGRNDEDSDVFDDPGAVTIDDGPDEPDDATSTEGRPARRSSRRDWIVRGVVFGTLAVLVVLALIDYRAKKSAEKTFETWQTSLKERNAKGAELYGDDLAGLADGSPVVEDRGKFTEGVRQGQTLHRYVWRGVFRHYPIEVYLEHGGKPAVGEIVPPSEVMAADQARADSE